MMLKKIGYGLILWVIPYVTAIPLLSLRQTDLVFFKTIMIVEGALVGGILSALYFQRVRGGFLREGVITSVVWMLVNWGLDLVALLPFTGHTIPRYFRSKPEQARIEVRAYEVYVEWGLPSGLCAG